MSYGFEVLNSSGVLIANSTDFNYGLVTSGSVTTAAGSNSAFSVPTTNVTFSNTGEIPLVFVRSNGTNWITMWSLSTTNIGFVGFSNTAGIGGRRPTAATTVDFRIYTPFRNLGNVSGQDYGIQIFDASGVKTFDSNYAFPRVVNSGSIAVPSATESDGGVLSGATFPSGVNANPWYSISHFGIGQVGTHYNNGYTLGIDKQANTYFCTKTDTTQVLLSYGGLSNNTGSTATNNWRAGVSISFLYLNV